MIIDTLENLQKYIPLNIRFKEVVDFFKSHNLKDMEEGKFSIDKDDIFVSVQVKQGKTENEAVLEYHRKMIDIQVPITGPETYGYVPVSKLPDAEFNVQKDIALLPDAKSESFVTCQPGEFVIFFPEDGHAPCISPEKALKKAVFKVSIFN